MPAARYLTGFERAERARAIVDAYRAGLPSRAVAERFGMSDGRVREIVRLYDAARPVGRPRVA